MWGKRFSLPVPEHILFQSAKEYVNKKSHKTVNECNLHAASKVYESGDATHPSDCDLFDLCLPLSEIKNPSIKR